VDQTPTTGTAEPPARRAGARRHAMLPRGSIPGSLVSLQEAGSKGTCPWSSWPRGAGPSLGRPSPATRP